jgi:YVTN family beta-propeller protein
VANLSVGAEPFAVAFDSINGFVYVANYASNNVSVIDAAASSVLGSLAVGVEPDSVAVDPVNGEVEVADSGSGSISIIAPAAVLTAVGISPAAATVTVGGQVTLTASLTCEPGPCPDTGVSYSWSLNNTKVNLSAPTGAIAVVTAGPTGGFTQATLNVTFANVSLRQSVALTIEGEVLNSVTVSPTSPSVLTGAGVVLTAVPTCSPNPCPSSGIVYSWSLSSSLATLSALSGATVTLTAGSTAGSVTASVTATYSGSEVKATASVVISSSAATGHSGPPSSDLLLWGVLGAVLLVVIVAVLLLVARRRRPPAGTDTPPAGAMGHSPAGAAPPPPPPP